ncbi:cell wall surface anchor family protein, partial [Gracilibacillus halophilus YIM-C55.5]
MKKNLLFILVAFVLFFQNGQLYHIGNSLMAADNGFSLSVDSSSTTEQATFYLTLEDPSIETLHMVLPKDADFDQEKTERKNSEKIELQYDQEDHSLLITNHSEENSKITLELTNLSEEVTLLVGQDKNNLEAFDFTISDTSQSTNTSSSSPITTFSGNLNADISLSPVSDEILSGHFANYNLELKLTGSTAVTSYTNAEVTVDLPITSYTHFSQNVDNLSINGVTPTYDEQAHTLTYQFDSIQTGRTYETGIEVATVNGLSPDGEQLTANASFEADQQPSISDDATVAITTSSSIDVSKTFQEVTDNDLNLATPNSTTLWEMKLDIPKNKEGQMYLKEGSEIIITDTLPDGLSYVSTAQGPEPVQDGNTLTWTYDAPTIEEQKDADTELYSTTIQVLLEVDDGTQDTTQQNDVSANVTYIDDSTETVEAYDYIDIVDSDTANGEIDGNYYVPVHIGPADGQGNLGTFQNKNPNPVVYDDALLGFTHGISPLKESQYGDFQQYTTSYDIDPNLIFNELQTPGGFVYRPNADHPAGVPLEKDPTFNLLADVNGEERLLVEDAATGTTYTRESLGLTEDDQVSTIYYDFTYAPNGMLNTGKPKYYFEVESGYTGEVRNEFNVYGVDGNGDSFNYQYGQQDVDTINGPRTAQITDQPTSPPPTAYVGVELLDHTEGEVTTGENRMKVNLNNIDSSSSAMEGPFETTVLLPPGVTLNDNPNPDYVDADGRSSIDSNIAEGGNYEVVDENYNNSGRQLVKVHWNDDLLRTGNGLEAELDVTISESAPNNLLFDVYGFSGESDLQVPGSHGSAITDTTLQTDEEDLNQNSVTNEPRLKSGNQYFIRSEYNLETEKRVKGELDEDYTYFGHTVPGGEIDYQLLFTNTTGKDISYMTLIDVLPSIGDLGITDNVNRGSQFTPIMTNSITLPEEWQNKVNVFYSTAKNPKRDDLTRNTDYPDSTTQLSNPPGAEDPNWMTESEVTDWSSIHSFKIEMKDGVNWIEGQDMLVEFSMQAPEATNVDPKVLDSSIDPEQRAAWNSFAMATDQGQPVEPPRVGAYMEMSNSVQLTKVNEAGETLQGAKFTLFNENGQEVKTGLTTDENGVVTVEDLLPGSYEFVETQAPKGYQLDETPISFEIESAYQTEQVEVTKENDYILGSVKLTKTGEQGKLLEGVEFELQDGAGNTLQEHLTTDSNGELLINDLKPGNYQLVETKTIPGYELDNTPIPFEIALGQTETEEVSFENPLTPGSVELTKVGELNEPLSGAEFKLLDEAGNTLQTELTTDENGKLLIEDLKPGNYELVETKAPFGHELDNEPIPFEIVFNQQETLQLTMENEQSTGAVQLTKTGEQGELLEGVEFELQDDAGNTLQEQLTT